MKTFDGKRITKKDIAAFNASYEQWPSRLNRTVTDKGEGALIYQTYAARECGCRVIGNGTLQFPLTVAPCAKHQD